MIQIWYFKRGIYDPEQDWAPGIDEYSKDEYGKDVGLEIKSFMPIFYDDKLCPESLLMSQDTEMVHLHCGTGNNNDTKPRRWRMDTSHDFSSLNNDDSD